MQTHERDLFISLCLGMTLTGDESVTELEALLEGVSKTAASQAPVSMQFEVGRWLGVTVEECDSRRGASELLWERISQRQYSLVDVPLALRRAAFGDEQAHRRKAWARGRPERMKAALRSLALKLIVVFVVLIAVWYLLRTYVL